MCCNRMDTDVLLANLFAANQPENEQFQVSMDYLMDYLQFLSRMFSEYLATDLCEQKVEECVAKYPQLYRRSEANGTLSISSGEQQPNIEYFNAVYSGSISNYIQRITNVYLRRQPNPANQPA